MKERPAGRPRILIIEDEPDLCEAMVSYLDLEGFQAHGVCSAAAADAWLSQQAVDIIILDVGLPDQDGISWIAQAGGSRDKGLIVTTARGALPDRIRGLTAGADAYLVKPVELEELRLVVGNVANRLGSQTRATSSCWTLDAIRWELLADNGTAIKLTRSETRLLAQLTATPGEAVHRDELVRALGYMPESYDLRRLEILTRRLRNKVSAQGGGRLPLETVHGYGYAFTAQIVFSTRPAGGT